MSEGGTTMKMRLSRPKDVTWWIAIGLGALGLLGQFGVVVALGEYSFFLVAAGLVLMIVATAVKNL
jgi:hypothetical protein